jgi:hypothetical protein
MLQEVFSKEGRAWVPIRSCVSHIQHCLAECVPVRNTQWATVRVLQSLSHVPLTPAGHTHEPLDDQSIQDSS